MLFPPRLIARYCAAMIVRIALSARMSPANPGTSGRTTTTRKACFARAARTMRAASAAPIWFFTGSPSAVVVMKNWFSAAGVSGGAQCKGGVPHRCR
jgi:hypothetical protein